MNQTLAQAPGSHTTPRSPSHVTGDQFYDFHGNVGINFILISFCWINVMCTQQEPHFTEASVTSDHAHTCYSFVLCRNICLFIYFFEMQSNRERKRPRNRERELPCTASRPKQQEPGKSMQISHLSVQSQVAGPSPLPSGCISKELESRGETRHPNMGCPHAKQWCRLRSRIPTPLEIMFTIIHQDRFTSD